MTNAELEFFENQYAELQKRFDDFFAQQMVQQAEIKKHGDEISEHTKEIASMNIHVTDLVGTEYREGRVMTVEKKCKKYDKLIDIGIGIGIVLGAILAIMKEFAMANLR